MPTFFDRNEIKKKKNVFDNNNNKKKTSLNLFTAALNLA